MHGKDPRPHPWEEGLAPRYRYRRELGSGGEGIVILVRDSFLGKDVALKLLHHPPATRDDLEELRREFALLSGIEHPAIARAYDFGFAGEHPYFTHEFVEGKSLEACARGDVAKLLRSVRSVTTALAFLHRRGIVHLDVKPANIIVPRKGDDRGAVLIDFGLHRRALASPPGPALKGSLPYMAPEFFRGGPLAPPTDVYALGVTLYRLATGRFPRPSLELPRDGGAIERAWNIPPVLPSRLRPSITAGIESVMLKCLAADPRSRFADAGALLEALDALEGCERASLPPARGGSSLAGREAEIAAAERFLDVLLAPPPPEGSGPASRPVALLVTGQPGMGQTRLLQEVKLRAQAMGFRFFLETGYPGRSGPAGEILSSLRVLLAETEPGARSRWERFLSGLRRPRPSTRAHAMEEGRSIRLAGEVALAAGAIREPSILAVDGLQFHDEVSVELVLALARFLGEKPPGSRPPLGLVLGFREEGTSAALLRELAAYLLQPGKSELITLRPLELHHAVRILEEIHGAGAGRESWLAIYQETCGSPARIVARAAEGNPPERPPPESEESPRPGPAVLTAAERRTALVSSLLGRPASATEIIRLAGLSPRGAEALFRGLEEKRLVVREEGASTLAGWRSCPAALSLVDASGPAERARIHRRIGIELSKRGHGSDDPRRLEALRHLRLGGAARLFVRHAVPAARYLKATFQNRAALDLLREVLAAIERARPRARAGVAMELSEVEARVGGLDEGIRILRECLLESRGLPAGVRARIVLRLASLYSRRGDYQRAATLFRRGLRAGGRDRPRLALEERLSFLNDYAAMKAFVGDYRAALDICGEGFRARTTSRRRAVREAVLSLHATRATVALRTFDHDAAIRDLEASLEIAESIGSLENQAVILNNLGIVHSNCDRHGEAIRAFTDAERISRRLSEGPSLVSIHANLAVLRAKTGDFDSMEKALEEAERLTPAGIGRRQETFVAHARGLSSLHRGRPAEARPHLEKAIRLAEETGDRLLAVFDRGYRAEALVFEGRYGEAEAELRRLTGPGSPPRVRKLAWARRALLAALTARTDELSLAIEEHARGAPGERPVPFLDAWDDLLLGWARSMGRGEEPAIEDAAAYFSSHGLRPARSLADWVLAESWLLRGEPARARETLESSSGPPTGLTAVLRPLLFARLLLEEADAAGDRSRCADLLAEAAAALVGNPMPEWAARIAALRALVHPGAGGPDPAVADRRALSLQLPPSARAPYLRSRHWTAWTTWRGAAALARTARRGKAPPSREAPPATRALAAADTGLLARQVLVARSHAMRELVRLLDRIQKVELPVLIQGETGSGKELVARIIHAESPRARGPFLVFDCAAVPAPLLEAELFGARAGAFTDLTEDRPGMLSRAAGGTLLLDEIGGCGLDVQAKLLGVLSRGTFRALGDEREARADARFLFSTARRLEDEVRAGRFREDLLHRIHVLTLRIPPLRERPEDIPALAEMLLREAFDPAPSLDDSVVERLRELPWPGNVRELRNLLVRAAIESPRRITLASLEKPGAAPAGAPLFPRQLLDKEPLAALQDQVERDYLLHHLRRLGGDSAALSRFMGLGRQQLYRRLRRLGVKLRAERKG
jgi:DNA-binding NtrC family response regulator/tetratricopeptide (TPR) repeat protein